MPFKNPNIKREYARLSMAIKKAKEAGEDISDLLIQRTNLSLGINGIKELGINNKFTPKRHLHPKPTKKTELSRLQLFTELIAEIKGLREDLHSEIKNNYQVITNQLEGIKEQLENTHQLILSKPITTGINGINKFTPKKPTEISVKKKPRKVIVKEHKPKVKSTSQSVKTTMRFDKNLLVEVQSFLTENPQSFSSFSQLVKDGISAYLTKKLELNPVENFNPNEKKTVRLSEELNNFYHSFPEGKKYLILNQILSSFLTKQ